ncbi:hypothetical protein, partial [Klebsiella pneumoniae]|uniref:hypothetical protein n=1 Tax=Klebsiella pneumoniae TaxID=573 RepID=UPI00214B2910
FMTLQIPFLAVALIVVFYVSQPNVLMIKLVSVVFFVTVTVALDGGRHRLGVILLRFDSALGQHDLRVEGRQPGFRVIEHCLI